MKKSTKALSAILSLSSVASVVAPVTTMAATAIDTAIAKAKASKTFKDYNAAYAIFAKLPAKDQAKYAAAITEIAKAVPQFDVVFKLLNDQAAIGATANAELFWANFNAIQAQVNNATDKNYLMVELSNWGMKLLAKVPGYTAATDAINAAAAKFAAKDVEGTKTAIAAAKAKIAEVTHVENKAFLTKTLNADVEVKLAAYEASLAPKVNSVVVKNNKTVVINFNKEVDSNTLNTTNISRSSSGTAALSTGTVFDLSTDKKTVTVYLSTSAAQQEVVELVVKDVKTTNGETIPTYKQDVVFFDNAAPEVSDVKAAGTSTIKIYFSEALRVAPSAKITMSGVVYQPTVSLNSTGTEGTIVLPVDMVNGNHTVEISGGQDYAQGTGFGITKVSKTFTYVKDATAITATVKESTEKTVTLKFNKSIGDLSTNAVAQYVVFSHGYKGYNAVSNNGSAFAGGSITKVADDEYKVTFNAPLAPGNTTLYFDYAANTADSNKVKDGYGNILQPFTVTVSTAADFVKPEVANIEFKDANTIKVIYSEIVNDASTSGTSSATNPANYILKDSDGKIVNISTIANPSADHKTFELTTSTLNGGTFTLEVKNVADISVAANVVTTVTRTFVATDKVAPTVTAAAVVVAPKKVQIKFSEAMDKASIEDKSMYNVDSKVKIVAAADNKSVILDYSDVTGAIDFTTGGTTTIQVGQVKDAAGNKVANFVTSVTVTHGAPTVGVEKVEVVALNKVKVYVDGIVTVTAGATIPVSVGGTYVDAPVESSTIIGSQTIITLTIPAGSALAAGNTEAAGVLVATGTVSGGTLTAGALSTIKNADNAQLSFTAKTAADKVAPSVVSRTTKDLDADGKIDAIEVVFSENLFASSVASSDFQVEGYVIEGISSIVNGSGNATVTIALKEGSNYDTSATPKVTVAGQVEDLQRNVSTAESTATNAIDGAVAIITSAAYTLDGVTHKLTVTFSENVTDETATPAALDNTDFAVSGPVTVSSVAHVLGSNTAVLTLAAKPTSGATVNAVSAHVEDVAGNVTATTTFAIAGL